MIFQWLICMQYEYFLSTCGVSSEVVFEFDGRATYSSSLRAKLILAPSMNEFKFFSSLFNLQKHTENQPNMEGCCVVNNQLPIKGYAQLEDDPIGVGFFVRIAMGNPFCGE